MYIVMLHDFEMHLLSRRERLLFVFGGDCDIQNSLYWKWLTMIHVAFTISLHYLQAYQ